MRRTKIVCTIGPSSDGAETLRALIRAGMNVARLNFSHGTHEEHRRNYENIRAVAAELNANIAIMVDLQGPKIRTGKLSKGKIELVEGEPFCITARDVPGDAQCVSTTYAGLPKDVKAGDRIMIADGTRELKVECVDGPDVHCTVVHGGTLGEYKGINLPGVSVSEATLTEKDVKDLALGLELGADFVALSFVRSAGDIRDIKQRISDAGKDTPVVAKIERPEAIENFDAILKETDVVMVARGDLGVEVSLETVPQIQKDLIHKCNVAGVPVITATQMLESMMGNARPTRAEATDVANAIYDGTDAVMLSGETAAGEFPVRAVEVMARIAKSADRHIASLTDHDARLRLRRMTLESGSYSEAIGQAVCRMTEALYVKRIVCFTQSGYTARAIAHYRPRTPVAAFTLSDDTARRCAVVWGVEAMKIDEVHNLEDMVRVVDENLLSNGLAEPDDTIVVVAGTPLAVGGRTNILKLHTVGEEE